MIALDIDQTLLRHDPQADLDYADPDSLMAWVHPIPEACRYVRWLHNAGYNLAYVTGRSMPVRDVTVHQLQAAGLPVTGDLWMQHEWSGYDAMLSHKRRALEALDAQLYVGDHAVDRMAAERAGVPFIHADAWHVLAQRRRPRIAPLGGED